MKSNRINYPYLGFGSGLSRFIQDAFEGFEDFGSLFGAPTTAGHGPRADLFEDDDHFIAKVELPGVKKGDVQVELAEGSLEVSATVSLETKEGRKNIPLRRSIPLPDQVGTGEVHAKLADGVLTVTLPKLEESKPRSITIE